MKYRKPVDWRQTGDSRRRTNASASFTRNDFPRPPGGQLVHSAGGPRLHHTSTVGTQRGPKTGPLSSLPASSAPGRARVRAGQVRPTMTPARTPCGFSRTQPRQDRPASSAARSQPGAFPAAPFEKWSQRNPAGPLRKGYRASSPRRTAPRKEAFIQGTEGRGIQIPGCAGPRSRRSEVSRSRPKSP